MLARGALLALSLTIAVGCSNNPYPDAEQTRKILYMSFSSPPKTLDPAVAYSVVDHQVTGAVYDTLLEYHYLKRPYELIPGLAEAVPAAEPLADGHVLYRFVLRPGMLYADDPALHGAPGEADGRVVLASDVAFAIARLADPEVNSPVISNFEKVVGFRDFAAALAEQRRGDPDFAALPAQEQYERLGGIAGVRALERDRARRRARGGLPADPVLVRDALHRARPVGSGRVLRRPRTAATTSPTIRSAPVRFVSSSYDRRSRIVLDRNDELVRPPSPRVASARRDLSRRGRSRRRARRPAGGVAARRCPSSNASSCAAIPNRCRRSSSSRRVTTTPPASSARASTASCTTGRSPRRWRRSGMRLEQDGHPGGVLPRLQHGRSASSARRAARAPAPCARR